MSNRITAGVLLTLGVLLFLVSAVADRLGLGAAPGVGWKQILGITVGVVLAAAGMVKLRR